MNKYYSAIETIQETLNEVKQAINGEQFLDLEGELQDWDFQSTYESFDYLVEKIGELKTKFVLDHVLKLQDDLIQEKYKTLNKD